MLADVLIDDFTAGVAFPWYDSNSNPAVDPTILGVQRETAPAVTVIEDEVRFRLVPGNISGDDAGAFKHDTGVAEIALRTLRCGGAAGDGLVLDLSGCDAEGIRIDLGGQLDVDCSGDGIDGTPITVSAQSPGMPVRSLTRMAHCAGSYDQANQSLEFMSDEFDASPWSPSALDLLQIDFEQNIFNQGVDCRVLRITLLRGEGGSSTPPSCPPPSSWARPVRTRSARPRPSTAA